MGTHNSIFFEEYHTFVCPIIGAMIVESSFGKYGVEVAKMRWDVLFVIHGLGVLLEAFCELLENHSGRADMLCLGKESGCPDSVAFFKWFIQEVSFQVGRQLRRRLGFIFLVGIFYESWERVSPAGINLFGVFPLGILFCLAVGLAA